MKILSPDDVKELRDQLDARKPQQEERDKKIQDELRKANATIRMLERRTRTLSFEMDLGNGDMIAVRSHLSPAELERMGEILTIRYSILKTLEGLPDTPEKDVRVLELMAIFEDVWLELISIIIADPTITHRWLQDNSDMISKEDMLRIYLAYKGVQKRIADEREAQIQNAISFRTDPAGTGIRESSGPVGDTQPGSMGGSPS